MNFSNKVQQKGVSWWLWWGYMIPFHFPSSCPCQRHFDQQMRRLSVWKVQIWCKWVCLNHGIPTSHLLSSLPPQNWQHIRSNPPFLDKPKYHLSVESSTKSHDHKLGTTIFPKIDPHIRRIWCWIDEGLGRSILNLERFATWGRSPHLMT